MTDTPEVIDPMTLATVTKIATDVNREMTQDQICEVIMKIDYAKESIRNAESVMKIAVQEWMESNDVVEFYIGPVKFYLGLDKTVKCKDVAQTLSAVLMANGVDPKESNINCNDVALTLSTNAFKQGACKKLLPQDKFEELFETKEETKLHIDGAKKAKEFKRVDTRFLD